MKSSQEELLSVENLVTVFATERGTLRAADDLSFSIAPGETVGLVGESGCGKSVTALSILRLLPPQAHILGGRIRFQGRNLLELSREEMRRVRGGSISMIFQDPMTSLNPVFRVGDQIAEAIAVHQDVAHSSALEQALRMMQSVGIPEAEQRFRDYPHQFSGGQRQRIMIAMALSCKPALLIADEPTTALDVTIQAQILDLLGDLRREYGLAILLITHDLGVLAEIADRVLLMYAGKIIEEGPARDLFAHPRHPYAKGLVNSLPRGAVRQGPTKERFQAIPGSVPDLRSLPSGCRFSDRCFAVQDRCHFQEPELEKIDEKHRVACWEWREL